MDLADRHTADLRRQDLRIGVLDAIVAGLFTKKGQKRPKPEDFLLDAKRAAAVEDLEAYAGYMRAITDPSLVPDWALTPADRANRRN
jgi:hypothetical protein